MICAVGGTGKIGELELKMTAVRHSVVKTICRECFSTGTGEYGSSVRPV